MGGILRWAGRAAALFCLLVVMVSGCLAAPSADPMFQADIMLHVGKKSPQICGRAMALGNRARLDVYTKKAGEFSVIADMGAKRMQVSSHALKAYVDIPLSGEIGGWRDLVQCAAAFVLPQSLGMMDVRETYRKDRGVKNLRGYKVHHFRSGFEIVFMGMTRSFEIETWENDTFFPFPMQAASAETDKTWGGKAYLTHITADETPSEEFSLPQDFTRYTSVMDLLLYALASF